MAIFAASGGSAQGMQKFDEFSAKSAKYDRQETINQWQSYRKSPPTKVGFGSLYYLAKQHGWVPGADIQFSPNKVMVDVEALFRNAQKKVQAAVASVHKSRPHIALTPTNDGGRSEFALSIWRQSLPPTGTLVETYLGSRGIAIPQLPAIRFHPSLI
jgi:hypothetical protein